MENNNLFADFDSRFDESFAEDVKAAANNNGEYEDLPHGDYEVSITKLEPTVSKSSGRPMITCWFKVVAGEHKGRLLFYNQVIDKPFCVHKCNEFLRSLGTSLEIDFVRPSQYADLVFNVAEQIDGAEYHLSFTENKGYDNYEIVEMLREPTADRI